MSDETLRKDSLHLCSLLLRSTVKVFKVLHLFDGYGLSLRVPASLALYQLDPAYSALISFYILNPRASREQWGYMVPSAPTDWLTAQTERTRLDQGGRGNRDGVKDRISY